MPFAHCIDCGSSALIDPSGRCPEGHTVGAAGARVAAAIGSATPHPDEPQPWVHQVQLTPELVDASPPEPRTVRPPSVPAAPEPARSSGPRAEQVATDDLMRELHALGDLGGFADVAAPTPAAATSPPAPAPAPAPTPAPAPRPVHLASVAPVSPAPPTASPAPAAFEDTAELAAPSVRPLFPAPAVRAGVPAPPSSPEEATDLSSLANLAAAVRSLDERGAETSDHHAAPAPTDPHAAPAPTGHLAAPAPTGHLAAPAPSGHLAAPAPTGPATASVPAPAPTSAAPPPPLFPAPTPGSVAAPVAAPATAQAPATEVAAASPFDGSFTARGDRPRRADARTAKKGLFRR